MIAMVLYDAALRGYLELVFRDRSIRLQAMYRLRMGKFCRSLCETGQILGTQLNLTRGGNGLAAPAQALSVLQPIRHAPDRLESSLASRVFTHIPVKAHWPAVAMDQPFPKNRTSSQKGIGGAGASTCTAAGLMG